MNDSVHRILDANANRAREALRVMEEAARFVWNDRSLAATLKQMRHDLAQALMLLDPKDQFIQSRDVVNDVGTTVQTEQEQSRAALSDVTAAASKRLSEALRSIEEYGKLIHPQAVHQIEQLRYRGYAAEQRIVQLCKNEQNVSPQRNWPWRVCLLLTESLCLHHNWQTVLVDAMSAGVDCVQVREKELTTGELVRRVDEVLALRNQYAEQSGKTVAIIVNDRLDVALACGADGVHLGQGDLPCAKAKSIIHQQSDRPMLVGVSTSHLDEARQAQRDGADYCGVGPIFTSTTKIKPKLAGLDYLQAYCDEVDLPHLAISGITLETIDQIIEAGGRGIAVSSAICSAKQPGEVAAAFVNRLNALDHEHQIEA